jgi:hypothetical protein
VTAQLIDPPVYGECVIGYRQWRLDDWVLSPIGYTSTPPWRPGVNTARCAIDPGYTITFGTSPAPAAVGPAAEQHAAPHNECQCGLYAYHDPIKTYPAYGYVWGAVAAWGNIEVHHNGFRAQYAQIVALAEPESREEAENLRWTAREIYKVPVVPYDQLVVEAERHGKSLPAAARPPKPAATSESGYPLVLGSGSWISGGYTITWPNTTVTLSSWSTTQVAPARNPKKPRKPTPKAVERARRHAMRQNMTKPQRAPKNL